MDARSYQRQLFELARKGNAIAILDTGSGKTLVALMLIKEMAAHYNSAGKKKVGMSRKIRFKLC